MIFLRRMGKLPLMKPLSRIGVICGLIFSCFFQSAESFTSDAISKSSTHKRTNGRFNPSHATGVESIPELATNVLEGIDLLTAKLGAGWETAPSDLMNALKTSTVSLSIDDLEQAVGNSADSIGQFTSQKIEILKETASMVEIPIEAEEITSTGKKIAEANLLDGVKDIMNTPEVNQWALSSNPADTVDLVSEYTTETFKEASDSLLSQASRSMQSAKSSISDAVDASQSLTSKVLFSAEGEISKAGESIPSKSMPATPWQYGEVTIPKIPIELEEITSIAKKFVDTKVLDGFKDALNLPEVNQWAFSSQPADTVDLVSEFTAETVKGASESLVFRASETMESVKTSISSALDASQSLASKALSSAESEIYKAGESISSTLSEIKPEDLYSFKGKYASTTPWQYGEVTVPKIPAEVEEITSTAKKFVDTKVLDGFKDAFNIPEVNQWAFSRFPADTVGLVSEYTTEAVKGASETLASRASETVESVKVSISGVLDASQSLTSKALSSAESEISKAGESISSTLSQMKPQDFITFKGKYESTTPWQYGEVTIPKIPVEGEEIKRIANKFVDTTVLDGIKDALNFPEVNQWAFSFNPANVDLVSEYTTETFKGASESLASRTSETMQLVKTSISGALDAGQSFTSKALSSAESEIFKAGESISSILSRINPEDLYSFKGQYASTTPWQYEEVNFPKEAVSSIGNLKQYAAERAEYLRAMVPSPDSGVSASAEYFGEKKRQIDFIMSERVGTLASSQQAMTATVNQYFMEGRGAEILNDISTAKESLSLGIDGLATTAKNVLEKQLAPESQINRLISSAPTNPSEAVLKLTKETFQGASESINLAYSTVSNSLEARASKAAEISKTVQSLFSEEELSKISASVSNVASKIKPENFYSLPSKPGDITPWQYTEGPFPKVPEQIQDLGTTTKKLVDSFASPDSQVFQMASSSIPRDSTEMISKYTSETLNGITERFNLALSNVVQTFGVATTNAAGLTKALSSQAIGLSKISDGLLNAYSNLPSSKVQMDIGDLTSTAKGVIEKQLLPNVQEALNSPQINKLVSSIPSNPSEVASRLTKESFQEISGKLNSASSLVTQSLEAKASKAVEISKAVKSLYSEEELSKVSTSLSNVASKIRPESFYSLPSKPADTTPWQYNEVSFPKVQIAFGDLTSTAKSVVEKQLLPGVQEALNAPEITKLVSSIQSDPSEVIYRFTEETVQDISGKLNSASSILTQSLEARASKAIEISNAVKVNIGDLTSTAKSVVENQLLPDFQEALNAPQINKLVSSIPSNPSEVVSKLREETFQEISGKVNSASSMLTQSIEARASKAVEFSNAVKSLYSEEELSKVSTSLSNVASKIKPENFYSLPSKPADTTPWQYSEGPFPKAPEEIKALATTTKNFVENLALPDIQVSQLPSSLLSKGDSTEIISRYTTETFGGISEKINSAVTSVVQTVGTATTNAGELPKTLSFPSMDLAKIGDSLMGALSKVSLPQVPTIGAPRVIFDQSELLDKGQQLASQTITNFQQYASERAQYIRDTALPSNPVTTMTPEVSQLMGKVSEKASSLSMASEKVLSEQINQVLPLMEDAGKELSSKLPEVKERGISGLSQALSSTSSTLEKGLGKIGNDFGAVARGIFKGVTGIGPEVPKAATSIGKAFAKLGEINTEDFIVIRDISNEKWMYTDTSVEEVRVKAIELVKDSLPEPAPRWQYSQEDTSVEGVLTNAQRLVASLPEKASNAQQSAATIPEKISTGINSFVNYEFKFPGNVADTRFPEPPKIDTSSVISSTSETSRFN